MKEFGGIYHNRRVLLTGHTGFKGSWFTLWLQNMGAKVTGVSLPPDTTPSHWNLLNLDINEHQIDIRDLKALEQVFVETRPEIVFHFAAQSLVQRSYSEPLTTWSTNVMGTANLLDICRRTSGVEAIVIVTSDKCYENREWIWGYRENDPLGGYDAYSASKAGAELVAASYRSAFFGLPDSPLLATVRAGNVIGGGDWSEDRLIPDLVRAVAAGTPLEIRSPGATRPWQHVLESLCGYLLLGQKLLKGKQEFAEAWNFGPGGEGNRSVRDVLAGLSQHWPAFSWQPTNQPQQHEAALLQLDSSKARQNLGWYPVWNFDQTLCVTADWYKKYLETGVVSSQDQIKQYLASASKLNLSWCS